MTNKIWILTCKNNSDEIGTHHIEQEMEPTACPAEGHINIKIELEI